MKANKKITKKEIRAAIKAANPTAICKAYFLATGERARLAEKLWRFIDENAASPLQAKKAYMGFVNRETEKRERCKSAARYWAYVEQFRIHEAAKDLRRYIRYKEEAKCIPYIKVPKILGNFLYFVSPNFGGNDYNKFYTKLTMQRDPAACHLLVSLGQRYLIDP